MKARAFLALVLGAAVLIAAGCDSGEDAPTSTTTPAEASPSPTATTTAGTSSATPTATVEPTASVEPTPDGAVIATILASEWDAWPDVVFEAEPLRTLRRGDEVEVDRRRWHWVHLVEGGWMPTDVTSVELSAPFDSLPAVVTPRHPEGTRTGLPAVDAVIERALAANGAALMEVAVFRDVECVRVGDTGQFRCQDGAEEGTVFSVFTFVGCHGDPFPADEAEEVIDSWARDDLELYAVYEREGGIAIVLTKDGAALTLSLTEDDLLEYVDFGCGLVPPELVVRGVTDFILAPPEG